MKKILALLLPLVLIFSCAKKDVDQDVLTLATHDVFPPFVYRGGETGNDILGFDIALAEQIAKDMGKKLNIIVMDFDNLINSVQIGEVDMAICAITITEARKRAVNFSTPYYKTTLSVVVKKEDLPLFEDIYTKEELGASKRLAAERGTTGYDVAKDIVLGNHVVSDSSIQFVFMELLSGNVDAVIIDRDTAKAFVSKYENLTTIDIEFENEYYGVAIGKDNDEILQSANKTIDNLINSGRYIELIQEHINSYMAQ